MKYFYIILLSILLPSSVYAQGNLTEYEGLLLINPKLEGFESYCPSEYGIKIGDKSYILSSSLDSTIHAKVKEKTHSMLDLYKDREIKVVGQMVSVMLDCPSNIRCPSKHRVDKDGQLILDYGITCNWIRVHEIK